MVNTSKLVYRQVTQRVWGKPLRKIRSQHQAWLVEPALDRQKSLQDCLELLESLVAIDSETTNISGVNRVQELVASQLERLEFSSTWVKNSRHDSGELLVSELKGEDPRFITMVFHADTVLPLFQPQPLRIDRNTQRAIGSGVIDDKGGIVVALKGIEAYLRRSHPRFGIRVISSPNEEVGSPGFLDHFRSYSRDSVAALGFEPALEDGSIVESRRGNRWYKVNTRGQEAHAGRSRGRHVNAAHELARKVALLHKLNDEKRDISVNVGSFQAGVDKYNVICGSADVKLDTRFSSFRAREALHKKIERLLGREMLTSVDGLNKATTTWEIVDDCPPFSCSLRTRPYVRRLTQILRAIENQKVESRKAGGAGDVNYLSREGIIVLDGLGPYGGQMHTGEEFLYYPSLVSRSEALAHFLSYLQAKIK